MWQRCVSLLDIALLWQFWNQLHGTEPNNATPELPLLFQAWTILAIIKMHRLCQPESGTWFLVRNLEAGTGTTCLPRGWKLFRAPLGPFEARYLVQLSCWGVNPHLPLML